MRQAHTGRVRGTSRRSALQVMAGATLLGACGRTDAAPDGVSGRAGPVVIVGSFPESGPLAGTGGPLGAGVATQLRAAAAAGRLDRQIVYRQYDDGYDPARLVANARRAVEQDDAVIFISFGGPSLSVRPYLHEHQILHIVFAANSPFADTANFPRSHAWWPNIGAESRVSTTYLRERDPRLRLAVLGYDNDLTDSQVAGVRDADVDPLLILTVSPSQVDLASEITQMAAARASAVLMSFGAAQMVSAIRYMDQIGYRPDIFLHSLSTGQVTTLRPLGPAAAGLHASLWLADPADPRWAADAQLAGYRADVTEHGRGADPDNVLVLNGYSAAATVLLVVRSAQGSGADDYNAAWNAITEQRVPGLLPGVTLTAQDDGRLVHNFEVMRYDGQTWQPAG